MITTPHWHDTGTILAFFGRQFLRLCQSYAIKLKITTIHSDEMLRSFRNAHEARPCLREAYIMPNSIPRTRATRSVLSPCGLELSSVSALESRLPWRPRRRRTLQVNLCLWSEEEMEAMTKICNEIMCLRRSPCERRYYANETRPMSSNIS